MLEPGLSARFQDWLFKINAMSESEQHLKRIHDKLQQLLKQHVILQKENQSLKDELGKIKKQAEEFNSSAENLKQQVEILKYNNGEMDEEEKKQFEKRLTGYLKEIDRCIVMLSQ
jgi:chromosome segregation ATPase